MMRYRWTACPPELRADGLDPGTIEIGQEFERYATVWDHEDDGGEIMRRGAFASLGTRDIPLLYNHRLVPSLFGHEPSPSIAPAGEILRIWEDEVGLRYRARLLDTSTGRDVAAAWRVLRGSSIGYDPLEEQDLGDGTSEVTGADLWEISLTEWPRQPLTRTAHESAARAAAQIFEREATRIRAALQLRLLAQEIRNG